MLSQQPLFLLLSPSSLEAYLEEWFLIVNVPRVILRVGITVPYQSSHALRCTINNQDLKQ